VLTLQEMGFKNVFALLGGLSAWQAAGLPTEQAPAAP
jgi:3-mercaptopyruvate sulfurtransferase SseA